MMEDTLNKELAARLRPFLKEDRAKSAWALVSSLLVAVPVFWVALSPPRLEPMALQWAVRTAASVLAGLVVVRIFVLYHDVMHGALFRGSRPMRHLMGAFGHLVLTPPRVWRETHNYHHAHTAKLVGSNIGSYAMVSTGIWAKMSRRERAYYRLIRHPLNIALAYFTLFMVGMCIDPLLRNPKKHWPCAVSLAVQAGLLALIGKTLGMTAYVFGCFIPLAVAMATGGYLFYAQHNFPEMHVQPRHAWDFTRAALDSSSYLETGRVMRWLTANIGYHHVHHLNPAIPFYRLPEAMEAIPELQHPRRTSLRPKDILACFRCKLWDAEHEQMVGYPRAASH